MTTECSLPITGKISVVHKLCDTGKACQCYMMGTDVLCGMSRSKTLYFFSLRFVKADKKLCV